MRATGKAKENKDSTSHQYLLRPAPHHALRREQTERFQFGKASIETHRARYVSFQRETEGQRERITSKTKSAIKC